MLGNTLPSFKYFLLKFSVWWNILKTEKTWSGKYTEQSSRGIQRRPVARSRTIFCLTIYWKQVSGSLEFFFLIDCWIIEIYFSFFFFKRSGAFFFYQDLELKKSTFFLCQDMVTEKFASLFHSDRDFRRFGSSLLSKLQNTKLSSQIIIVTKVFPAKIMIDNWRNWDTFDEKVWWPSARAPMQSRKKQDWVALSLSIRVSCSFFFSLTVE